MKIALFDPYMPKFTQDMVDWWMARGYEVRRDRYYDPALVDWADVIWFETCDHNLEVACKGLPDHPDWPLGKRDLTGKKIIVRVIDIEAWYGHHLNVDWGLVDDVIFLAPHIRDIVSRDIDFTSTGSKIHIIPGGVNLGRFTFVDKPIGKKIAWVCEKWPTKGIDYALQIMAMLPKDYELHALGPWNDRYAWEKAYQEDFIKRRGIQFYDYEYVPDVNDWLTGKDFILSCSKKEAFGYNIAEGMAKGLIPIIHRFFGCDDIWGIESPHGDDLYIWDTVEQAASAIYMADAPWNNYPRQFYRTYLEKRGYTTEAMMQRFEEVINGKD